MADDSGERTESASEKRRQEFRDRGEVARSRDIVSVLVLLAGFAYLSLAGDWIFRELGGLMQAGVRVDSITRNTDMSVVTMMSLAGTLVNRLGRLLAPLVGTVVVVSILANVAQVGVLLTLKPLEPDLSKLNFFTRFFSTFISKQAFGQLITNLAKIAIVATVVWLTLASDQEKIRWLSAMPLLDGIRFVIGKCLDVLLNVALVLITVAAADYMWSRHMLEEKMKMTKQEVKDEHKEYEGNPQVKGQMRQRAREMANNRMMQAVPEADVVVNNPTHLSIALRYRQGVDAAPAVIAKGADHLALRIRRVAATHKIPMVRNVPLARMLYRHVKVGRPVPSQFYRAVAEVLAYVYRLRDAGKGPTTRAQRER